MTTNNTTINKNLTILFAAEKHAEIEQLAKQQKRPKGQIAGFLIEEALNARRQNPTPQSVDNFLTGTNG